MDELKIKFIYNGEESFFNFINYIKYNSLKENSFDKHVWSGDLSFLEKERDFAGILFKIFFILGEKRRIPVEMNLWYR